MLTRDRRLGIVKVLIIPGNTIDLGIAALDDGDLVVGGELLDFLGFQIDLTFGQNARHVLVLYGRVLLVKHHLVRFLVLNQQLKVVRTHLYLALSLIIFILTVWHADEPITIYICDKRWLLFCHL